MASHVPPISHLSKTVKAVKNDAHHAAHLQELAIQIRHNLQYQHDWTDVFIHTYSPLDHEVLERPVISGKPPRRVYIHPDELLEFIKADVKDENIPPQREWVLPSHLKEKWSMRGFAAIFDSLSHMPPANEREQLEESNASLELNRKRQAKRLLLATVDNDSTVVYYIMHDGIVKPRQN